MTIYLEGYIFTDQPTTCPKCGCRTEFIEDSNSPNYQTQQHKCLSNNCLFEFIMQNETE